MVSPPLSSSLLLSDDILFIVGQPLEQNEQHRSGEREYCFSLEKNFYSLSLLFLLSLQVRIRTEIGARVMA